MKNKYRVVTDKHAGYEAQVKYWYWPFWVEVFRTNTHKTIEEAVSLCKEHASGPIVVKEVTID